MPDTIFDARNCFLGEGPLWHPLRQQLFWFDIINKRLLSRRGDEALQWQFDEHVSAAGWIDYEHLIIASESGLARFSITSGERSPLVALPRSDDSIRSNDGRADPHGGFWIGTMGKAAQPEAGAIYRYYQGELRQLYSKLTIPNAICFSADKQFAYFADTPTQKIFRQTLDNLGWPQGEPQLFIDLSEQGLYPDGAVIDAEGALWNAQWGQGRVARYLADGSFDLSLAVTAKHSTCPAFGGEDFRTIFVTTAQEGLETPESHDGATYALASTFRGVAEPAVKL